MLFVFYRSLVINWFWNPSIILEKDFRKYCLKKEHQRKSIASRLFEKYFDQFRSIAAILQYFPLINALNYKICEILWNHFLNIVCKSRVKGKTTISVYFKVPTSGELLEHNYSRDFRYHLASLMPQQTAINYGIPIPRF